MSQTDSFVKYNKKTYKIPTPIFKTIRFNRYKNFKLSISVLFSFQTDKLFVGWHQSTGYTLKSRGQNIHKTTESQVKPKGAIHAEPGKCPVTCRRAHTLGLKLKALLTPSSGNWGQLALSYPTPPTGMTWLSWSPVEKVIMRQVAISPQGHRSPLCLRNRDEIGL